MKSRTVHTSIPLALGLGLLLALLWATGGESPVSFAQGPDGYSTYHVAPSCTGVPAPCYTTVQAAVDAADDPQDVIAVAAGTYTNVHVRSRNDFTTTGAVAQVVYVSKTVTIRGGYTPAFIEPPDPAANPTTLDAQGQGRVVYITGNISPTIEGLRITRGDASGLGGLVQANEDFDAGGGVYVYTAAATVTNCEVYSNTASTAGWGGYGGGLFLGRSAATLSANVIQRNTASPADLGCGGGLCLEVSPATLSRNTIQGNTASETGSGYGGGICLHASGATLSGNTVHSNTASTTYLGFGGGLWLYYSSDTLIDNTISYNVANDGGGLYAENRPATLIGNTFISNTAHDDGGGLYLDLSKSELSGNSIYFNTAQDYGGGLYLYASDATLTNTVVANNAADRAGSGLYVRASSPRLLHATIAWNNHGDGRGIHVTHAGVRYSTLALTNTIVAGHSVGIEVTEGNEAVLESTLWYDNGSNTGGVGIVVTGTVNVYGDPAFANPSGLDYHLTAGSAAQDAGVDANVTVDMDGDPRPIGVGYDIGADEYARYVYLPSVLRQ